MMSSIITQKRTANELRQWFALVIHDAFNYHLQCSHRLIEHRVLRYYLQLF